MAEQSMGDKYIKCSRCVRNFINDNEHLKNEFGYNRLEERFKTCVQCRGNKRNYISYNSKMWYEENRDAKLEYIKQYRENNKDAIAESSRLYKLNNAGKIKESREKTYGKHEEQIIENQEK